MIPSVKHFAANNEEFERHRLDEQIDERALHEIYLPAFKAAVQQADVWTVMSAYEKVNGKYCAENAYLLTDILKKEFGFKGFVISDWGSTYSTAPTVNAGMDLEMPGGPPLKAMLTSPQTIMSGNSGRLARGRQSARRSKSRQHHRSDARRQRRPHPARHHAQRHHGASAHTAVGEVDTPEQQKIAREGATEGIVLLKNQNSLLPLDPTKIHSIAVIGPNALVARTGGGGSSLVRPKYAVSPLQGIQKRAGAAIQMTSALGVGMEGEDPAHDTPDARANDLKAATEPPQKPTLPSWLLAATTRTSPKAST